MLTIWRKSTYALFFLTVIVLIHCSGLINDAKAGKIGLPEIFYDSNLGPGQNIYTTQGFHYTAGVGLGVSAKASAITFDGINMIPLINGTVDFHAAFIDSSVSGGFVTGNFTGVGGPMADLIVADNSGVLVAGKYISRTIKGVIASNNAATDSLFVFVGGSLAPFYAASGESGTNFGNLMDITPAFSATTFAHNFDGNVSGAIAPLVPEPSTFALLTTGVVGLLGYAWRYAKRKGRAHRWMLRLGKQWGVPVWSTHMGANR